MPHFFTEPVSDRWVYPCSIDELQAAFEALPSDWTDGIDAIGLCRSTRRDSNVSGRYWSMPHVRIGIYSWPVDLRFRLFANTKYGFAARNLAVELEYGMKIDVVGPRLICRWGADDLRRYILGHVLIHEVGHHVYHRERMAASLRYESVRADDEKFAESFALRFKRSLTACR